MHFIAYHDSMTGLLNRRSYKEFSASFSKQSKKQDIVVVVMDINGLKPVNDNLGHDAGDELIRGAANCMRKILSPHGKVYRMGGDEFTAIITGDLKNWPDRLNTLKNTFDSWSGEIVKSLSVSVGTATNIEDKNLSLEDMVAVADKQMYSEKNDYYVKTGKERRST